MASPRGRHNSHQQGLPQRTLLSVTTPATTTIGGQGDLGLGIGRGKDKKGARLPHPAGLRQVAPAVAWPGIGRREAMRWRWWR
jgi:hypothetical protein